MPRKATPKYGLHKTRSCAVVAINGRDHDLDAYDSRNRGRSSTASSPRRTPRRAPRIPPPVVADSPFAVSELVVPLPCSEAAHLKLVLPPVVKARMRTVRNGTVAVADRPHRFSSVIAPVLSANLSTGTSTAFSMETNRFASGTFLVPSKACNAPCRNPSAPPPASWSG